MKRLRPSCRIAAAATFLTWPITSRSEKRVAISQRNGSAARVSRARSIRMFARPHSNISIFRRDVRTEEPLCSLGPGGRRAWGEKLGHRVRVLGLLGEFAQVAERVERRRSEEHTSELQSLMRI